MTSDQLKAVGLVGQPLFDHLVTRFYKVTSVPEALAAAVERMKQEIMQDASGPWPRLVGCTTFSQLHDIVDANEYGGFCESDFPGGPADIEDSGLAHADQFLEAQMRFINAAQDAVHQWLVGGGLAAPEHGL